MIPYRSVHFVGALTAEMAGLTLYTSQKKIHVTASDDHRDAFYAQLLEDAQITFYDMFSQNNIGKTTDLVVLSPYYDSRHIEAEVAQRQKIAVITATEYAKLISEDSRKLAILGEYESPIIATWLEHVWNQAHVSVQGLTKTAGKSNPVKLAVAREADWFVLPLPGFKRDAGTYEAEFLSYSADTVIIPSIMYDFPELNTTLDDVYQSYYAFVKRVPRKGLIIGNGDWSRMKRLRSLLADRHIETYGYDRDVSWQIYEVKEEGTETSFSLVRDKQMYGPFIIPYQGEVFVTAAVAVTVASLMMDIQPAAIGRGLETLPKLNRYLDVFQDKVGRVFIDDRADHPSHIRQVLETVKKKYPDKKIWCLYQSGSFLRTKALFSELEEVLALADFVYLADIKGYPKEKSEGLHIRHFVADMRKNHPQTYYFDETTDMTGLLRDRVPTTDCVITLGVDGLCQVVTHPLMHSEDSETHV